MMTVGSAVECKGTSKNRLRRESEKFARSGGDSEVKRIQGDTVS
jgi:hypothetical protein